MIAELISSMFSRPTATLENPSFSLNDPAAYDMLGGVSSDAGIPVTPRAALSLAPVWQGVSTISGDVATSTADVFKRNGDDREIDLEHPADRLISEQPNDEMSSFDLMRRLMLHALIWQNGYLFVDRTGGTVGRPVGLYNLLPDRTKPARDENGKLFYITEVDGRPEPLAKEQVIHLRGLSLEIGLGYDLVVAARNSWGLALAAEGFGSKFFANGAQSGGIIEVPPGTMQQDTADKMMQAFKKKHSGKDNWFKVMVLRDGVKFHATTLDAQKSQLTALREQQVRDTARFFNLPPSKLGLEDSVSYNSSEQAQIQYITGCLTHWFAAIRGEMQLKLLTEQERRQQTHFIDFNTSKLIERDLKTQVEILEIERRNEIINANEWRRKINLSPRTDKEAEEYINPNTKSANAAADPAPKQEPPKKEKALSPAAVMVCEDAINRMARRVGSYARAAAKNPAKLVAWLDAKAIDQRDEFHTVVMPAACIAAESTGEDGANVCYAWSSKFFSGLLARVDDATKPPFLQKDLEANVDEQCRQFQASVCSDLLGSLIGGNDDSMAA